MSCRWLSVVVVVALAVGCATTVDAVDEVETAPIHLAPESAERDESTPRANGATPPDPATRTPTTNPTTSTASEPVYVAATRTVTAEDLGASWRPGCPVAVEDLRRLDVRHWNDIGEAVDGVLVVHSDHTDDLIDVFGRLFDAGFPIHSMRPSSEFDGDDDRSMGANNSSAFNCREIAGRPGVWSEHAHGGAVDLNPLVNPWVRGAQVDPPGGAVYTDRTRGEPGMVVAGGAVTAAFAAIGWQWGGDWASASDYQHFSHNGR